MLHRKINMVSSFDSNCKRMALYLTASFLFFSCNKTSQDSADPLPLNTMSSAVAVQWGDMTLYTIRFSAFNSPTYTSRSLGYLGLAMYESVVNGDPSHLSMNGQLNGLTLPSPEKNTGYQWELVLNAAEDTLLKLLYPAPGNSHRFIHDKIDSLYRQVYADHSKYISLSITGQSVKFGQAIALALYQWSLTDGGDEGYSRNFDPGYAFPSGPSYWVPPVRGQVVSANPLHPHWGNNRTFVTANSNIPIPSIVPFSTDTSSAYYKLYKAVFDKDHSLTQEEMEIAAWWGDDPTETFSPPGHSYYVATLAVKKSNASLMKAAEAYARTGMAVADAFINCWKAKVVYFNERPSSYVKKYIQSDWVQFWPEPPFPAFPSGHATQGAAAAAVLTNLFGDSFSFTDNSHEGFRRYDSPRFLGLTYPARNFNSFWEAANECAYSRFLGGIHTQQDNDVGTKEGTSVGENINSLHWKK